MSLRFISFGAGGGLPPNSTAFFSSTLAPASGSAALQVGSNTAGRRSLLIQNLGLEPIYLGLANVTAATGIKVLAGDAVLLNVGANIAIYAVSETAPQSGNDNTRWMETF
jgi:hypothetical protein